MEESLTMGLFTGVWAGLRETTGITKNFKLYYQWELLPSLHLEEHREKRMLLKLDYNYNLGRVIIQQKMDFYIELIYAARKGGEEK